jgi:hypothetical protein
MHSLATAQVPSKMTSAGRPSGVVLRGPRPVDCDELLCRSLPRRQKPSAIAMVTAEGKLLCRGRRESRDLPATFTKGVRPGRVASLDAATSSHCPIAITQTGAAWLPFDADAPLAHRPLSFDAEARALTCLAPRSSRSCPTGLCRLLADPGSFGPARSTPRAQRVRNATLHTSGSTGTPRNRNLGAVAIIARRQ